VKLVKKLKNIYFRGGSWGEVGGGDSLTEMSSRLLGFESLISKSCFVELNVLP